MRFTINKNKFLKALLLASHGIGAKNPIPQLMCFKIEMAQDQLEITSSNDDLAVFTRILVKENDKENIRNYALGTVLVNAHILTEIVRKLGGSELSFEVIDERMAKIDDGNGTYKLVCMPADEYPDIDMERIGTPLTITSTDLAKLVDMTAFAALDKETRRVLMSINLKAEAGSLVATATDSARLSRKSVAIDPSARFSVNIPAKTLVDVVKMFENNYEVELSAGAKRAVMSFGDTVVSCRVIDENYPVSSSIIPQIFNASLEVNSAELLTSIDRVSTLSSDRAAVVKLSMSSEDVELSSSSDQNGTGTERLGAVNYEGERLEIAFNAMFVTQAVRALGSEDVVLKFIGEMKPFVIENPKDDTVIELITPMRTR